MPWNARVCSAAEDRLAERGRIDINAKAKAFWRGYAAVGDGKIGSAVGNRDPVVEIDRVLAQQCRCRQQQPAIGGQCLRW